MTAVFNYSNSLSGMCNPRNYSDTPATSKSTVEDLYRPIPSLFRALTEGEAPINMMVVSFPVAEELSYHESLVSFLETMEDQHQNVSLPGNSIHSSYDNPQGKALTTVKSNFYPVAQILFLQHLFYINWRYTCLSKVIDLS